MLFLNIYPNAKVLAIEPRSFTPNKRIKVLEDIRDNDYDGIIIAYSCFSLIPLSKRFYTDKLEKQIEEKENEIAKLKLTLENPEICSDYVKIMEIQAEIDKENLTLENLMTEWLSLSE